MSDASGNTISFILPPPSILTHLLSEFLYLVDNLLSTISCEEDIPINMRSSPSGERGGRRREEGGGGGRRREEEGEGGRRRRRREGGRRRRGGGSRERRRQRMECDFA